MLEASLGVDRTLPGNLTATATFIHSRTWRALRSRVVGLPDPGGSAVAYQYESTGRVRQDQLILGLNRRFDERLSLSVRYFLAWARSDTDGAGSSPADSSNPAADWGRASMDVRHRLVLTGSLTLPGEVRLSPLVIASSGAPFNITIGRDVNGDTVFTDRPAFASDSSLPEVVDTPWGLLDPTPGAGEAIVPRDLGQGPGFVSVNLRVSRTFRFRSSTQDGTSGPEGPRGPGGPGFGGRGAGRGGGTGPGLTVGVYAQNLFNRVNPGPPVGNLSSPSFGESLSSASGFGRGPGGASSAGNRTIEIQVRASF